MQEEQQIKEKPKDNIIAQIIYRYLPFWPIFVLLTSISLIVAQTRSLPVTISDPVINARQFNRFANA